jgi:aryl-alcohol dehydrogenase-like predicted oxidoreductase
VALDEGGLTGRITADSTFPDGDFRNRYFGGERPVQVEEHVTALVQDLGIRTDELADVALRYVLDNPAVSTVIAGMRSVRNVERNAGTSDGRRLTEEQRDVIRRHRWERNFYQAREAVD